MISERDIERWFESSHYRKKSDWVCIDQPKVIQECFQKNNIGQIIIAKGIPKESWMEKIPIIEVNLRWMIAITGKKSHHGVMIIIERPIYKVSTLLTTTRMVILDGVQDPGNLGTIIRSMVAFNCFSLGVTSDCVDPFHPKAVNASAGSMSKISIFHEVHWESFIQDTTIPIYTLHPLASQSVFNIKSNGQYILICGSEGHGIKSEVIKKVKSTPIAIPMSDEVESLNVSVSASIALNQLS